MDNSRGFIYVATGSMQTLTEAQKEIFTLLTNSMKYDFLISSSIFSCDNKNVKIVPWVNQLEVLKNPNILAFICHGGFGSITEAIQNLVPILCLPQDKDQFANCDRVKTLGAGLDLQPYEVSLTTIEKALNEIISNKEIKKVLSKTKTIMNFSKGDKRAADLLLFFAKAGYEHLVPRWYNLVWYEKYELDVFFVYFLVVSLILWMLKKIFLLVLRVFMKK